MNKALLRQNVVETLIFSGFAVFSLLGILNHEMWRDELQAWMLARDSTSLLDLLQNMSHEGHPALWHFCLYGLAHITHNPLIMQVFHLGISLGSVYLLLKYSPFSILHKFLLSFSYFTFYEYTVISRSYSLGIMLAFLFCAVYTTSKHNQSKQQYFSLALILALMANVSAYSFLISIMLAFFLMYEALGSREKSQHINHFSFSPGIAVLGLGWLMAAWQIARARVPEINYFGERTTLSSLNGLSTHGLSTLSPNININPAQYIKILKKVGLVVVHLWDSYVPIPPLFTLHFWNENILTSELLWPKVLGISITKSLGLVLSIIVFSLAAYIFSRKPTTLWTYVFGTVSMLLFQTFIHLQPAIRHDGHLFIVFILCSWLHINLQPREINTPRRKERSSSLIYPFLSTILGIQMIAGIYAMGMDYSYPFSSSKAAAAIIKNHHLSQVSILGDHHQHTSILSGYLDVPIYYADRQEFGTFWGNNFQAVADDSQLVQVIGTKIGTEENQTLILALTKPLSFESALNYKNISVTELATFSKSIVHNEQLYLYLAKQSGRT